MKRTTPKTASLALRLVGLEASQGKPADAGARVLAKLRLQLSRLLGTAGFHALLSRAWALAAVEVPSLRDRQPSSDGSIEPVAGGEGELAVITHLLKLLVTFIGEALVLQLLQVEWPKAGLVE